MFPIGTPGDDFPDPEGTEQRTGELQLTEDWTGFPEEELQPVQTDPERDEGLAGQDDGPDEQVHEVLPTGKHNQSCVFMETQLTFSISIER